jgi:MFS transporter, PHS family, inorganic phosphate transporter
MTEACVSEPILCVKDTPTLLPRRYDVFAISIASIMLGYLYGDSKDPIFGARQLSPRQDLALKLSTSIGTLVGHLAFGWAADIVGRRRMCEEIIFILV